jgi:hypothetical protein
MTDVTDTTNMRDSYRGGLDTASDTDTDAHAGTESGSERMVQTINRSGTAFTMGLMIGAMLVVASIVGMAWKGRLMLRRWTRP